MPVTQVACDLWGMHNGIGWASGTSQVPGRVLRHVVTRPGWAEARGWEPEYVETPISRSYYSMY